MSGKSAVCVFTCVSGTSVMLDCIAPKRKMFLRTRPCLSFFEICFSSQKNPKTFKSFKSLVSSVSFLACFLCWTCGVRTVSSVNLIQGLILTSVVLDLFQILEPPNVRINYAVCAVQLGAGFGVNISTCTPTHTFTHARTHAHTLVFTHAYAYLHIRTYIQHMLTYP